MRKSPEKNTHTFFPSSQAIFLYISWTLQLPKGLSNAHFLLGRTPAARMISSYLHMLPGVHFGFSVKCIVLIYIPLWNMVSKPLTRRQASEMPSQGTATRPGERRGYLECTLIGWVSFTLRKFLTFVSLKFVKSIFREEYL